MASKKCRRIRIDVKGGHYGCKYEGKLLISNKHNVIVNINKLNVYLIRDDVLSYEF